MVELDVALGKHVEQFPSGDINLEAKCVRDSLEDSTILRVDFGSSNCC